MLTRTDRFTTANSLAHFHRHQEVGFMEEPDVIDFSVDDLLDFSGTSEFETEVVAGGIEPCVSVKFTGVSGDSVFPPSEISVPADDVAELEWLSRFVEDSFSEYSQPHTGVNFSEKTMLEPDKIKPAGIYTSHLFPPPMTKPRAKGRRSSGKSWVLSAASDTTSSSCSVSSLKPLSAKRQSRRPPSGARRCSHCGVQRTPQWRAGPGGAKTLCNACGVRFKSGRLCPEYRPACSPTFSSELHSNQHRKVVEMRRKKMVGLAPTVQSL